MIVCSQDKCKSPDVPVPKSLQLLRFSWPSAPLQFSDWEDVRAAVVRPECVPHP